MTKDQALAKLLGDLQRTGRVSAKIERTLMASGWRIRREDSYTSQATEQGISTGHSVSYSVEEVTP